MRGRVIILLGLIAVVVIIAVLALVFLGGEDGGEEADTTPEAVELTEEELAATAAAISDGSPADGTDETITPEAIQTTSVVIAAQDLPRGFRLTDEFLSGGSPAVIVADWPVDRVPQNSYAAVEDLEGLNLYVRSDIPRESPVLSTQLVEDMTKLADVGSDAALLLPPGLVAVSMPLDISGIGQVAYGLQHGDAVDVILSFLFIEVDETFQSRQPNSISVITRDEETNRLIFSEPLEGRPEPSTLSSLGVLVVPQERQRPRLVTQRIIEDAYVLHVGLFPPDGNIVGQIMTPTPEPTAIPEGAEVQEGDTAAQPTAVPLPTATPYEPTIITLGVEPQDALILTWALDAQIPVTYALRSATDTGSSPQPTAVTLQYLIENYSIPQPPILPFSLEPSIESLRRVQLDSFQSFIPSEDTDAAAQ